LAGRVQDVTDPRGIVARTLYDALGRTTATIANFTGAAPGSQTDVTTLFSFDSAGRLASRTAVQPAGTPSQVTGYVYGVSPATGSTIASNDLMAETRYPDPVTGLPSATERDIYTSNALGERTSFTDRAGTTHTYAYDVTGRQTADAITAVGTNVSATVRRIESAYDVLGRVTGDTSFDAPGGGTAVNQVTRAYNGFGQLTSEWQSHTGLVAPATTPRVQYAYSQGSGGNHSRLTRVTYPDGYALNYTYSGIDSAVSRPTSLSGQRAGSTSSNTLEAFKYLGAGTVIERSRSEVNITLSMMNFSGATADAGDKYTGLDRFGRVVDQRWTKGTTATSPVLDRYGYTYDRNSNRLTRSNVLAAAFSETYAYDALNQLQSFNRGNTPTPTTSQQWQFDALGNWTTVTTNGVAQNRTANAQNELTQVGSSALAYSTTGNLTTDAEGRTLSYDAWNRLVSVKNAAGTEVARYEYDGLNRRIVEQAGTLASPAAATAAIRDVYYSQDWQVLEERVRTSPSQVAATADARFIWSPVYVDAMVAARLPHPVVDEQRRVDGRPELHVTAAGGRGDEGLEDGLSVFAAAVRPRLAEEQVDEHVRPAVTDEPRYGGVVGLQAGAAGRRREPLQPGPADRGRLDHGAIPVLDLAAFRKFRRRHTLLVGDDDPRVVHGRVPREQTVDRQQKLLTVEESPFVENLFPLGREDGGENEGRTLEDRLSQAGGLGAAVAEAAKLRRAARQPGVPLPLVEPAKRGPLVGLVYVVRPGVLAPAVGRDDVRAENRPGLFRKRGQALLDERGILDDGVVVDDRDEVGAEHVTGMPIADVVAPGEAEVLVRDQERHVGHAGKRLPRADDGGRRRAVVHHHDVDAAGRAREPPQRGDAAEGDLGLVVLQDDEHERPVASGSGSHGA